MDCIHIPLKERSLDELEEERVLFPIRLLPPFCTLDFSNDNRKDAGTGTLSGVTACFDVLMHRESLPLQRL